MKKSLEPEGVLDELRMLCSREMAAVETYDRALDSRSLARFAPLLRRCRRSHQECAYLLGWRLYSLGALPPQSTSVWGVFSATDDLTQSVEEKTAIAVLEAGEARDVEEYRKRIPRLDPESKDLVEGWIFRAQMETHVMIHALKREIGVAQAHAPLWAASDRRLPFAAAFGA